jgi:hypothetical protein
MGTKEDPNLKEPIIGFYHMQNVGSAQIYWTRHNKPIMCPADVKNKTQKLTKTMGGDAQKKQEHQPTRIVHQQYILHCTISSG